MKIGLRTPSASKRIKARTTGKLKRGAKRAINPTYGMKGMGYIKDPERAIKNKIYHKVTVDPLDLLQSGAQSPDDEYHAEDPDLEEAVDQDDGLRLFPFMFFSEIICLIVTIVKFARGNFSWPWTIGVFVSCILYFVFKRFDL